MSRLSNIRPRWNKVVSDLTDNKTRSLLVVASIAVGVFAVGTTATAYVIISEDMTASYVSANPANIEIITDGFSEDFVRTVEKIPGVENAEGRRVTTVSLSPDGEVWTPIDLMAIDKFEETEIFTIDPYEGQPNSERRELVVERGLIERSFMEIAVGDSLEVRLEDGTIREMPVVGIVTDQSALMGGFASLPLSYVQLETMGWLGQPETFNRLYVTIQGDSNDVKRIEAVSDDVEDKIERSGRQVYRTQTNETDVHPLSEIMNTVLGILGALGFLVMLLSGALIANTLNALLGQHMRQIGVMKLVGARSFQIIGMYIVMIVAYGIIALLIGAPLGTLAGNGLARFMSNQMNIPLQGLRIVPLALVLQAMGAFIVPLMTGFIPINNGSKTKIDKAISDDRPLDEGSNSGWLDRIGAQVEWISRPILLSFRNTFRRKGRLALTLFTLTIGGAVFISVFNVRASMQLFIEQIGEHFIADVTVTFDQSYRNTKVERAILQVPGVEYIEAWSGITAEILDEDDELLTNLLLVAPPAETELVNPEIVAGRWVLPGEEDAFTVADSIYDILPDLQPGDTLTVEVPGHRKEEWTVVGIYKFASQIADTFGYADYEAIAKLMGTPNQSSSFRVVIDEHSRQRQDELGAEIDNYLRDRGFGVASVESGLATMGDATEGINILTGFLLFMALLSALVGSIGLTGTMGMNVLERTREIGVMRAIGAVDSAIIKSVVIEGAFIGVLSWVMGAILSFPISILLLRFLSRAFGAPIPADFTLFGYVVWLGAVLLLSATASALPARSASRLTIREVLAYE